MLIMTNVAVLYHMLLLTCLRSLITSLRMTVDWATFDINLYNCVRECVSMPFSLLAARTRGCCLSANWYDGGRLADGVRAEARRGRDPRGCGTSLGRAATALGENPKERRAAPRITISPSCAAALVSRAKTGNTARCGRGAQLRGRSRHGIARRCRPRVLSGIGLILTRLLSGSDRVGALGKNCGQGARRERGESAN